LRRLQDAPIALSTATTKSIGQSSQSSNFYAKARADLCHNIKHWSWYTESTRGSAALNIVRNWDNAKGEPENKNMADDKLLAIKLKLEALHNEENRRQPTSPFLRARSEAGSLNLHHLAIEPEETAQCISSLQDLILDSGEDEAVGPVSNDGQIEANNTDILFGGPPAFQLWTHVS
jgi:hypothetical protein